MGVRILGGRMWEYFFAGALLPWSPRLFCLQLCRVREYWCVNLQKHTRRACVVRALLLDERLHHRKGWRILWWGASKKWQICQKRPMKETHMYPIYQKRPTNKTNKNKNVERCPHKKDLHKSIRQKRPTNKTYTRHTCASPPKTSKETHKRDLHNSICQKRPTNKEMHGTFVSLSWSCLQRKGRRFLFCWGASSRVTSVMLRYHSCVPPLALQAAHNRPDSRMAMNRRDVDESTRCRTFNKSTMNQRDVEYSNILTICPLNVLYQMTIKPTFENSWKTLIHILIL